MHELGELVSVFQIEHGQALPACFGQSQAAKTEPEILKLVVSTQTLNFGSVTVGQTANATVSVGNPGSAPVSITQIQLQGSAFALTGPNNVPISVAGGASYNMSLSFHPTAAGAATGALVLTSNVSSDAQVTIALSGSGESIAAPALSGLSCGSASITGAGSDACPVTLTAPALRAGSL